MPKARETLVELRRAFLWISSTLPAEHSLGEHIEHRSHADRGLLTLPTVKMGWQATELERQGIKTDVGDQNRAIKAYNEQVLAYQTLKSTQSQEKSDERAKQLISTMARPLNQSERENGNGREISSGSRQESHTEQGRSSSPVSQAHTAPNQRVISKTHENATGTP